MKDMTKGSQFSSDFRRSRACGRCTRLKTRCAFETPSSTKCIRCEKGGYVCEDAKVSDKPKRTRTVNDESGVTASRSDVTSPLSSTPRVALESQSASTSTSTSAQGRRQRIQQLRQVATEVQQELDMLEGKEYSSPRAAMQDLQYNLRVMKRNDPLEPLVGTGVLTYQRCEECLQLFIKHLNVIVPLISTLDTSLDELRREAPCTALAVVVCAHINTALDDSDELTLYLLRSLTERAVVEAEKSVDLARALLMTVMFIKPLPDGVTMPFLLTMNLATHLQLGAREDSRVLISNKHSDLEKAKAKERMRLYVSICAIGTTIGVNSSHHEMLTMVHIQNSSMDVLFSIDDPSIILLLYMYRVAKIGHEGNEALKNGMTLSQPVDVIQRTVGIYQERLNELYEAAELVARSNNVMVDYGPAVELLRASFDLQYISINQYALNGFIFGRNKPDDNGTTVSQLFYEIVSFGRRLLDRFMDASSGTKIVPRSHFGYTLQALTALVRTRVLVDVSDMKEKSNKVYQDILDLLDLENQMTRICDRARELSQTSSVANNMCTVLLAFERWVKMRLDDKKDMLPPGKDGKKSNEFQFHKTNNFEVIYRLIKHLARAGSEWPGPNEGYDKANMLPVQNHQLPQRAESNERQASSERPDQQRTGQAPQNQHSNQQVPEDLPALAYDPMGSMAFPSTYEMGVPFMQNMDLNTAGVPYTQPQQVQQQPQEAQIAGARGGSAGDILASMTSPSSSSSSPLTSSFASSAFPYGSSPSAGQTGEWQTHSNNYNNNNNNNAVPKGELDELLKMLFGDAIYTNVK